MVLFSQTAEYALRAVLFLAAATNDSAPRTVQQIAAETKVPVGYLSKVLQSLCRAGLVSSQRGIGGGFRLAKSGCETTIYDVIQAVDPIQRIRTCPLGLQIHSKQLCPLHQRVDNTMALIEEQFRATMITELIETEDEYGQ